MKRILTDRLVIRRFEPDDWPGLFEYLSDSEVVRFEPYDVYSEERAKEEAVRRAGEESFHAVCLRQDGRLIGNLYLGQGGFDTWELGYVFNRRYQGQGYVTEGARALLDHAFLNLGARRIVAMCSPENKPSWRLLERLNMRREGLLLKNVYFKKDESGEPIWLDTYEYALLKSEWNGAL